MDDFIEGGKIINTHGVAGDVKAEVWLDSPDMLKKVKRLFVDGKDYTAVRASVQKSYLIIHINGVETVDDAVQLKNKIIYVSRDDIKLPKGRFFIRDILGATCLDPEGKEIGILTDVIENPAHLIYVIKGKTEHLVPAVPEYIMSTDVSNKQITVRMIEGM